MENQYPKYEEMENQGVASKPPKRKRIEPKPIVKAKVTAIDKVKMFYGRYNGNANAIAAQTGLSKQAVEQIIRDENL